MTPQVSMSTGLPDVLGAIVAATRRTLDTRRARHPREAIERQALEGPRPRGDAFVSRLCRPDRLNVIAECKRRSPLEGVLREQYDPEGIARDYERAGAAALSILTEPSFFDGSLEHLARVRRVVGCPLLRKDFVLDEYQLFEACLAGADAALLIVACLDDATMVRLLRSGGDLGLAMLVEAHDEVELARAIDCGAALIGVNNRDLRRQEVSVSISRRLIDLVPDTCVAVAESGLRTGRDLASLRQAGFDAFLVGERLMRTPAPGETLAELLAAGEACLLEGLDA